MRIPLSVATALLPWLTAIAADASPPVAARDFTIELWLKGTPADGPAPATGGDWLRGDVVLGGAAADGRAWGVSLGDGRVAFGVTDGSRVSFTVAGETPVLDGAWHHVAVTRRRVDGLVRIWVNGALDAAGEGPDGDLPDPGDGLGVPSGVDASPFRGELSGVRVSSGLRYEAPFARPAAPAADPPTELADVRGLPDGAVFEAHPHSPLGQTILFARFPDDRTGSAAVTILDARGGARASVTGKIDAGSAMILWDGRDDDGAPLPAGPYSARLVTGETVLSAEFVLP